MSPLGVQVAQAAFRGFTLDAHMRLVAEDTVSLIDGFVPANFEKGQVRGLLLPQRNGVALFRITKGWRSMVELVHEVEGDTTRAALNAKPLLRVNGMFTHVYGQPGQVSTALNGLLRAHGIPENLV